MLGHDVNGRGTVSESPCSDDTEFSEPSLQAEDNDVVRSNIFFNILQQKINALVSLNILS